MAKRGRPAVKVDAKEYIQLRKFLNSIAFYTKKQAEFYSKEYTVTLKGGKINSTE